MNRFFEIVELSNGDIVLRNASDDQQSEPAMVTINFSEQAKDILQAQHLDVARTMLEAGIRKVGEMSGMSVEQEELETFSRQLH